jgi:20S proteasome alpha/beta subunit
MTVCIAAKAKNSVIVTASDMKISVGHTSSDVVMLKIQRVHDFWHVMIAGKIAQTYPVLEMIEEGLSKIDKPKVEDIRSIAKSIYSSYGRALAEEKVLSQLGLDLKDFIASREKLGDVMYQQLMADISRVQVGCDLLIVGHDHRGRPHILAVSTPTDDHPSFITDYPAFAAIGSGGYLADTILHSFSHYSRDNIEDTIYHVACAKFMAESASDVGPTTYLQVISPDGTRERLSLPFVDTTLRATWEEKGKPRVEPTILPFIKKNLAKL